MTYRVEKTCHCGKKAIARGLCRNHYTQAHKKGTLKNFALNTPVEAFEARIEKTETCWLWKGTKNTYGYGIFLLPGEIPVRAHRYAYELWKERIPQGLVVMHSCDNPLCVNPAHLSVGTRGMNNLDCAQKGRKPHGANHWNTKLTPIQVEQIRASEEPQWRLAKMFGVAQTTISRIKSGKRRARG